MIHCLPYSGSDLNAPSDVHKLKMVNSAIERDGRLDWLSWALLPGCVLVWLWRDAWLPAQSVTVVRAS